MVWEAAFEDCMNLIAKLPSLAAMIYRHKYKNNDLILSNKDFDWAGNYGHMLGYDSYEIRECLRGITIRYMIYDIWYVICDIWYVIYDI